MPALIFVRWEDIYVLWFFAILLILFSPLPNFTIHGSTAQFGIARTACLSLFLASFLVAWACSSQNGGGLGCLSAGSWKLSCSGFSNHLYDTCFLAALGVHATSPLVADSGDLMKRSSFILTGVTFSPFSTIHRNICTEVPLDTSDMGFLVLFQCTSRPKACWPRWSASHWKQLIQPYFLGLMMIAVCVMSVCALSFYCCSV